MQSYNIVTKRSYEKNGETKTQWNKVGRLVYFPERDGKEAGFAMELNMFPDTKFYVFEEKTRDEDVIE